MQRGLQLVFVLIFTTLSGYIGASTIQQQPLPINLRIDHVEISKISRVDDYTLYEFDVTIEIWNERYREMAIRHGPDCGILPGVRLPNASLRWLNPPLCDPALWGNHTEVSPGLSTTKGKIRIANFNNHDTLPTGQYQFFAFPSNIEYRADYILEIKSDGTNTTKQMTTPNWGQISLLKTPLSWYLPAYTILSLLIIHTIRQEFVPRILVRQTER